MLGKHWIFACCPRFSLWELVLSLGVVLLCVAALFRSRGPRHCRRVGTGVVPTHGSSLAGLSGAARRRWGRRFAGVGEIRASVKSRRGGKQLSCLHPGVFFLIHWKNTDNSEKILRLFWEVSCDKDANFRAFERAATALGTLLSPLPPCVPRRTYERSLRRRSSWGLRCRLWIAVWLRTTC